MGHESRGGRDADTVEMHLSRSMGMIYCALTAVVLLFVGAGVADYLGSGRFRMALVTAVVGLAAVGFLGTITATMILPLVIVDRSGVRGRTPRGRRIAAGWEDITLDVDDNAPPGTIRLHLDRESLSLSGRSWSGFRDFVILVASTPVATGRLSPSARAEVIRLLRVAHQLPGADGDRPA